MAQPTIQLRRLYPAVHQYHRRLLPTVFRSADEATRFTGTSPHPSKQISARSSTFSPTHSIPSHSLPRKQSFKPNQSRTPSPPHPPPFPSPPNASPSETPAQKVARLRAARLAARQAQIPLWDRIVVEGRMWADRIHRFTALSLIGFTIICGAITVASLIDMITINRKKRDAFYADEKAKRDNALAVALDAARAGAVLTEEQLSLVEDERFRIEEKERKKREGWGVKKFFFGGGLKSFLMAGLDKGDGTRVEIFERPETEKKGRTAEEIITEAVEQVRMDGKTVLEEGTGKGEKASEENVVGQKASDKSIAAGGPVDQLAEKATEMAKPQSWWGSWWGGK